MAYKLEMEIPGLPVSLNVGGNHYHFQRNKERKRWHEEIAYASVGKKPKLPLEKVKLILIRFSSRTMDYDGIVGSFKPVVDGLIHAGIIINDTIKVTGQWDCDWKYAPIRKGKIYICVEEIK